MSTVQEIKHAAARLSVRERLELLDWLNESEEIKKLRWEQLRRDLLVGIKQADRGELLDGDEVFDRVTRQIRRRTRCQ